jgi:hypothetical protein
MTPRQQRNPKVRTRKKEPGDFYFQHLPSNALENVPEPSLGSLENEINLMRYLLKIFFDKLLEKIEDLKTLSITITKIGAAVMQVSRLISIYHKLDGEAKPAHQLQKALEEILTDVESSSSKEEC